MILKRASQASSSYVDYIYSPETFAETFSHLFSQPLSKLDQLILLKYLSRDKKEITCSPNVSTPYCIPPLLTFCRRLSSARRPRKS